LQGGLENTPFVTRVQRDSALKVPLFLRLHVKAAIRAVHCPLRARALATGKATCRYGSFETVLNSQPYV
jgi:hypothetical protein